MFSNLIKNQWSDVGLKPVMPKEKGNEYKKHRIVQKCLLLIFQWVIMCRLVVSLYSVMLESEDTTSFRINVNFHPTHLTCLVLVIFSVTNIRYLPLVKRHFESWGPAIKRSKTNAG